MTLARAELARLSELLDEALDLPIEQRAAWLERLAPVDATLRPRLQALLEEDALEATGDRTMGPGLLGVLDALPQLAGVAAEARIADAAPGMRQVGTNRQCFARRLA